MVPTIVTITACPHLYMHISSYFSGPPHLQTCSTVYGIVCSANASSISSRVYYLELVDENADSMETMGYIGSDLLEKVKVSVKTIMWS